MAKKNNGFQPLKTGYDPRNDKEGGNGTWLSIKAGESVDVVSLVDVKEIIRCEQCAIWMTDGNSPVWVYTGEEDPMHDLEIPKRYRAYLPLLIIENGKVNPEPKVWSMGKQAHGMLLDIADAGGSLKGSVLRIKRTGEGLKTKYSIAPRGKRVEVKNVPEVDVASMLGPLTSEDVKEMLAKKFDAEDYDSFLEEYKGRKSSKAGKKKQQKQVQVEDDEEEQEIEDDEEEIDDLVLS